MALSDINVIIGADLSRFNSAMRNLSNNLDRIGKELQSVGKTISISVTAPLALLAGTSLKAAGDMQALKKGLEAITGSAEAAEIEFAKLKEVAKLPGLGLEEAVQMSLLLQSTGFSADKARTSILQFGNALALVGRGREDLGPVLTQLSQMASKSKVVAGDLKPIMERVPQVAGIVKRAFGTLDTEVIQGMGVSTSVMIDTIISELQKLPRATGGINNAFENAKDAVTQALAGIGDALNKAFNIEGIINRFSDFVIMLVDKFNQLSPAVQKTIFTIAGIAAAIGPVILILGALSSAIAAISAPVLIVVASVAAAVALITTYWDDLVNYFNHGDGATIWDNVKTIAMQLYIVLEEVFSGIYEVLSTIWKGIGTIFTGDSLSRSLKYLTDFIKSALDNVINMIRLFKGIFTGNWELIWDSVLNLGKIFLNSLITIAKMMVDIFLDSVGVLVKIMQKVGVGDELVEGFKDARKSLDTWVDGLKMTTSTAEKTEERIKSLTDSFNKLSTSEPKNIGAISTNVKSPGFKPGDAFGPVSNVTIQTKGIDDYNKSLEKTHETLKKLKPVAQDTYSAINQPTMFEQMAFAVQNWAANTQSAVNQAAQNIVASSAEMVGAAIATGQGLDQLPIMILNTLLDLASQVGRMAIGIGIAVGGVKKALQSLNPVVAIVAGVALVALAGAAKAALSSATGGNGGGASIPKFANGGLVYGPTVGLMGEYHGASSNPEVIAPLSKLNDMISQNGNSVNVNGEVKIKGSDMYLLIKKETERRERGG